MLIREVHRAQRTQELSVFKLVARDYWTMLLKMHFDTVLPHHFTIEDWKPEVVGLGPRCVFEEIGVVHIPQ
jgi:hypothetical protein